MVSQGENVTVCFDKKGGAGKYESALTVLQILDIYHYYNSSTPTY